MRSDWRLDARSDVPHCPLLQDVAREEEERCEDEDCMCAPVLGFVISTHSCINVAYHMPEGRGRVQARKRNAQTAQGGTNRCTRLSPWIFALLSITSSTDLRVGFRGLWSRSLGYAFKKLRLAVILYGSSRRWRCWLTEAAMLC